MASKYGLISIIFGIVGIIFLFIFIIPITAMANAGWGSSPNWIAYFALELILSIITIMLGILGKSKDKSTSASKVGLIIGSIIGLHG